MSFEGTWDSVPDTEMMPGRIEHHTFSDPDFGIPDRTVEAFYHPPTATAARILEAEDGEYSVQPSAGGFPAQTEDDPEQGEPVVQPPRTGEMVSGSVSVVATNVGALADARAVAYGWIRGWTSRNMLMPDSEGGVRDVERDTA